MLKALWTGEYNAEWDSFFSKVFELTKEGRATGENSYGGRMTEDRLIDVLKDKDIFIIGYDPITRKVLENCPDLKLILSVRDGPEDNIDIEACTEFGVPIISAGGRCVHSVAETNLAIMLNMATRMITLSNRMRAEGWNASNMWQDVYAKTELFRKTLTIIGLGRNGKELARVANGIGMKVVAYDPYVSRAIARSLNVTLMPYHEAIAEGDYVTLLARVTPETTGMFGKEEIECMKPTAYLINTGRPKLADYDAILDALKSDRIAGAALDVYYEEPLPKTSPIYDIPPEKLILTPHIAGISVERCPHQYENTFAGYELFREGNKDIPNLYNPKVFDSPEFKNRGEKLFGK